MQRKVILIFFLLVTMLSSFTCKKPVSKDVLKQTETLQNIDGVIGKSEYSMTVETEKMMLYLSRDSKELTFGLGSQTMGWIAIGFGSMSMDKSHIIIGYSAGDTMAIKEHNGMGHRHQSAENPILINAIIKENDGTTIFEGSVRAEEVIQPGQSSISIIIACGAGDDFASRHIFRKSLAVMLAE
ncbi:MAG: hypothetical protein JXB88_07225 [Spirochaetales bacterium]|nr:hypothetical protein [Spirochaetales bacterium]